MIQFTGFQCLAFTQNRKENGNEMALKRNVNDGMIMMKWEWSVNEETSDDAVYITSKTVIPRLLAISSASS